MASFQSPSDPPFRLDRPAQQRVPFVFNSPHSGRRYPADFIAASPLDRQQLRRSEDVMVDALFAGVVQMGAPLLAAQFPRAWLDVNREPYELDPKLFRETLPNHANKRSPRVNGGLGTIPRLVAENMAVYREPPSLAEGLARIENVYRPYHDALRRLMGETAVSFGFAVLVDCHSMPSAHLRGTDSDRPDIIIGDRYGTSCHGDISRAVMDGFAQMGYKVGRNKPYAGGFITEHYGRPLKGLHAVQIEINRGLYIDEQSLMPTSGFMRLRRDIAAVMNRVVSLPDGQFSPTAIAAE